MPRSRTPAKSGGGGRRKASASPAPTTRRRKPSSSPVARGKKNASKGPSRPERIDVNDLDEREDAVEEEEANTNSSSPSRLLERLPSIPSFKRLRSKARAPIKSFFAPLQRNNSKRAKKNLLTKLHNAIFGFFLLDKIEYKNVSVWIAAYHYIPVLALIFALTVNTVLFVFFSLVFPLMTSPDSTEGFTALAIVMAHMGVLIGCTTVGYKLLSVIVDAMIDSCLVVVDPDTRDHVFYYSMLQDLRYIAKSKVLSSFFVSISCLVVLFIYLLSFRSLLGFNWEKNEWNVFYVALATMGTQSVYFIWRYAWFLYRPSSVITPTEGGCGGSHTEHEDDDDFSIHGGMETEFDVGSTSVHSPNFTRFYSKLLPRVRRRSHVVMIIAAIFFGIENGMNYGISCLCEGMLYLNMPHLIASVTTKLTLYLDKLMHCYETCATNSLARKIVGLLVLPWFLLAAISLFFFDHPMIAMIQVPPLMTLFTSSLSLFRLEMKTHSEQQHGGGAHSPRNAFHHEDREDRNSYHPSDDVAPTGFAVWQLALKLYLCNTKDRFRRLPHFRAGLLVRILLRSTLLLLHIVLILLALWVSAQASPSFGAQKKSSVCTVTAKDAIRVDAAALVTDLYGMAEHKTPEALVYERDAYKYDPHRYDGLCSRQWYGSLYAGDLAYFSITPYHDVEGLGHMLSFYRKFRDDASDWEIIPVPPKNGSAIFLHFHSKTKGVDVLAIRGTDVGSPFDFLQNIVIYAETFIFQMLALVVPGSSFLPERTVIDFIAAANVLDGMVLRGESPLDHHYHTYVEEYAKKLHQSGKSNVILTGHSLGGVVAQIVGARLHLPAVGFGSPGITLMQKKLRISPDDIDAYTTNVIASNDLISRIDKLGGNIQHIQCEHRRADICHSIELHLIRLWTMCSNYRAVTRMNGTYAIHPQLHDNLIEWGSEWLFGNDGFGFGGAVNQTALN